MDLLDKIIRLNHIIITIAFVIAIVIIVPFNLIGISLPNKKVTLPPLSFHPNILRSYKTDSKAQVAGAYAFILPTVAPTLEPSPTPIPVGLPISIEIEKIGISAQIIPIGITNNHSMDIPKDYFTTGWYEHSVKPGEAGSAIINGHFDTSNGDPAIFYKLGDLVAGDVITISTDLQQRFSFVVDESFAHPLENFPNDIVYDNKGGHILKLITCDGIWNPVNKTYSNRRVVIAHLREKTGVEVDQN